MAFQPCCFNRATQEGAGRSLAVGPCDMEYRRQLILRIPQSRAQRTDPLQPQRIAPGRERRQSVKLRLDGRVIGLCVVSQGRELGRLFASGQVID